MSHVILLDIGQLARPFVSLSLEPNIPEWANIQRNSTLQWGGGDAPDYCEAVCSFIASVGIKFNGKQGREAVCP